MRTRNFREEKAVTITVLVIAIIVLIILAGISITAVVGENGIISKAMEAKVESEIKSYEEELKSIEIQTKTSQINKGLSATEYLDEFYYNLTKSTVFENSDLRRRTSLIRIQTPEGYIFYVTENETKYAGKVGEVEEAEDLTTANVEFKRSTTDWTNDDVTVEINLKIATNSELQYSLDGVNWAKYDKPIAMKTNGTIHARLYSAGYYGDYISATVNNIDKLKPKLFNITAEIVDETSIKVSGSTEDEAATSEYGSSGLAYYEFSKDGGSTWEKGDTDLSTEHTFIGLDRGQTYEFAMRAVDNATNEQIATTTQSTISIPDLVIDDGTGTVTNPNVTITGSPTEWTKGEVEITMETTVTGYNLEYSVDNKNSWHPYDSTNKPTVSANGRVYARLAIGNAYGQDVYKEISNIDTVKPQITTALSSSNITTSGFKVSLGVTDSESGFGRIEITCVDTNGSPITYTSESGEGTQGTTSEVTKTYEFTGVPTGTYTVTANVYDKVENGPVSSSIPVSIEGIPSSSGNVDDGTGTGTMVPAITFDYDPNDWTNGNVTVTINANGNLKNLVENETYSIEYTYTPDDENSWKTYQTGGVSAEINTSIYARLTDGVNSSNDYATGRITQIDKLDPQEFTPNITEVTSNSITVSAMTEDQAATSTNGKSEIEYYQFSKDGGVNWEPAWNESTKEGGVKPSSQGTAVEYTFPGLADGTTYTIVVKAVDKAGNHKTTSVTDDVKKTTETVTDLTSGTGEGGTGSGGNIEFSYEPNLSTWTKQTKVTLIIGSEIQTKLDTGRYFLEYSDNKTSGYSDYDSTTGITAKKNGKIYVRLTDRVNAGNPAEGEVTNIDTLPPNSFALTVDEVTTNTIKISGSTTDAAATSTSGCSGELKYYFSSDNGLAWYPQDAEGNPIGTTETTYTFTGLTKNVNYTLKIKAVDQAGNTTETDSVIQSTDSVPALTSANMKFNYEPTSWTNDKVIVTIEILDTTLKSQIDNGTYTLRYSKDNSTFDDYNSTTGIEFTQNGGVYARLKDSSGEGRVFEGVVDKIDKDKPNTFSVTVDDDTDITTNSIKLHGHTTDAKSGMDYYQFSIDGGDTWYPTDGVKHISDTTDVEYEFTGLSSGENCFCMMRAYDLAGNFIDTDSVAKSIKGVDALTSSNVTFEHSTSNWTNGDVVVTISPNSAVQSLMNTKNLTLQYSTDGGTNWDDYDKATGVKLEANGTVSACLRDAQYNRGGKVDDNPVTCIDKTLPSISTSFSKSNVGTNKFTLSVGATDTDSGFSKVIFYYKHSDDADYTTNEQLDTNIGGTTRGATSEVTKSIDITSVKSGIYTAYVEIYDVAGNKTTTESSLLTIDTGAVTNLTSSNTSFDPTPNYWTNGSVSVTVTYPSGTGFTPKYTTGDPTDVNTSWSTLTKAIPMDYNGNIYVRFTDGTNVGNYATGQVNNIDTKVPTIVTDLYQSDVTTKGFTLNITVQDEIVEGETYAQSGLSKIIWYYKLSSASSYTSVTDTYQAVGSTTNGSRNQETKNHPFTNLTSGTYSAYAEVYDVAGNKTTSKTITFSTGTVEGLTAQTDTVTGNIKLNYDPSTWTKGSVNVTVEVLDTALQAKIDSKEYTLQYAKTTPGTESNWSSYPSTGVPYSSNGSMYVRVTDGTNKGEYATGTINNIDTLNPTAASVSSSEAAISTITVTATATDAAATSTSGCSGIAKYYYSSDNGTTWYPQDESGTAIGTTETTYTFTGLTSATSYSIKIKAEDAAGNTYTGSATSVKTMEGDYVNYAIDINGDTTTTNDWRLFYVTEGDGTGTDGNVSGSYASGSFTTTASGQAFLIAANNIPNSKVYDETDSPSGLLKLSATGMTANTNATYTTAVYWSSAPTKQWTELMTGTTNSLFMFNWSKGSTSTYNNMKAVSTLLNTENWDRFVDSVNKNTDVNQNTTQNFGEYAIGSPTLEMWVASWNKKYTQLYYNEGSSSNGYYIGLTEDATTTYQYVTSSYVENSGYDDTIYFPGKVSNYSYWLASPSADYSYYLMFVDYYGYVNCSNCNLARYGVRPVVSLKSGIHADYNTETGIWTLTNP